VRALVSALELAVITVLADHGIHASARADAPGVYVADAKIAALGLRVRKGCSLHGLALNVSNDLTPYQRINPCGYAGQVITRTVDLGIDQDQSTLSHQLAQTLAQRLGYDDAQFDDPTAPSLE
jgi:lipoyl(octanoyl) transferase